MSRVLPILFNTDMVRAILEGRKTVTRRAVKVPEYYPHFYKIHDNTDGAITCSKDALCAGFYKDSQVFYMDEEKHIDAVYYKAPCKPGDILYVRETWQEDTLFEDQRRYFFKADENSCMEGETDWRPSIYMPKEAARIWLRVTDVQVEKLQDITTEQIIKEGANQEAIKHYIAQMPEETEEWIEAAHRLEWQQLWNSTIRKPYIDRYGWEANPYVWVIEFERCEKPE